MSRAEKSAVPRSRGTVRAKTIQHRHFRLTPHPHSSRDVVILALLVIGVFVELVMMTSIPLGVSSFELNRREAEGREAGLEVRSQRTYRRWYRDEIQSFLPRRFFSLDAVTDREVKETEGIYRRLLATSVSRSLQEVHLGLVILASRKQAYLSQVMKGERESQNAEGLQRDLDAFRRRYDWLEYE